MPELDLDAIRARAEAVVRLIGKPDRPVTGPEPSAFVLAARDIPALLARLAEAEGERDFAVAHAEQLAKIADTINAAKHRAMAERDAVDAQNAQLRRYADALKADLDDSMNRHDVTCSILAERDAMRPVVEAAKALRASFGPTTAEHLADLDMARLVAAVDALQEGPASPPERPLPPDQPSDVTSSTDGNVAQEGSRGAGDNLGNVVGRTLVLGVPLGPPADPPWLEEAIEAAYHQAHLGAADGDYEMADIIVRAALPLIAEGVLREAADEIERGEGFLGPAFWLRERAARQVSSNG